MSGGRVPVCLNVTFHIDEKYGGLAASMPRLCKAVSDSGRFSSPVAAFCEPDEEIPPSFSPELVHRFPAGRLRWATDRKLQEQLRSLIHHADIVHIHGLWREYSLIASRLSRALHKPYVVSAHGMLDSWALANGKWRKRIYLAAMERSVLNGASALRALTQQERLDYENVRATSPVRVIPNGIDSPEHTDAAVFLNAFPHLADQRLILFMGRIHPKKGIDLLLRAWSELAGAHPDVHVVVAGPDDGDTVGGLTELVESLGLEDRLTFTGMLRGKVKSSALSASTVFVLPSHSEGFSVAVLEALASGVPVIISDKCHFPEVAVERCGWQIQPDQRQLGAALSEALRLPPAELRSMGEAGKRMVSMKYAWSEIGSRVSDMLEDCCRAHPHN